MEELIARYGYTVIFLGTLLEGETIYLVSAYLAHAGYLKIDYVMATGFLGTFLGDQIYFFIGRRWGQKMLVRKPSWTLKLEKVFSLLERHETLLILSFRFIYGLRNITPFAIGMSKVKTSKFIFLNLLSALAWAAIFGAIGYVAGEAIHAVIDDVKHVEIYVVGTVAIAGTILWGSFLYRRHKKIKSVFNG